MRRVALRPSDWPVTIKAPILVIVLMIALSAVITKQVLSRLEETQTKHLQELAAAYLDGLSSSLIPAVLREDVWETFDILDRAKHLYRGLNINATVVTNGADTVLAAVDPTEVPSYSKVPDALMERYRPGADMWLDEERELAGARRVLVHQGLRIGAIYGEFDVAGLFRERRNVLWTLIGTNAVIALALAAVGYLSVRRILRPVHILTHHLHHGVVSHTQPIPDDQLGPESSEFGQLFRRYNALVHAMQEREALAGRLAEDERLSSLGRLASGMAHEINNPLGGLFNALETLKRHGAHHAVRERAVSLLERGLSGIRDVVRSALVTYRIEGAARPLKPADIDDLGLLIKPEVERRALKLRCQNELTCDIPVRGGAIRQAVLNLLLNACHASPPNGEVHLSAGIDAERLSITVADEGPGLEAARVLYLEGRDNSGVPQQGEAGLGLWIVRRLVGEAGGVVRVNRPTEGGTIITITVPLHEPEAVRDVA